MSMDKKQTLDLRVVVLPVLVVAPGSTLVGGIPAG